MKYYFKSEDNSILSITDDGSQDFLIQPTWVAISEADVPVLLARFAPAVAPTDKLRQEISTLESAITPRRLRESILGTDGGWLSEQESKIVELRNQLRALGDSK